MSVDVPKSDVLDLYRAFDPPPEGFDIARAATHDLLRHGLPRRPDPETEPRLDKIWRRAFVRAPKFVKAELAIDPVMSQRDPLRRSGPDFGPSGWGGAVVDLAAFGSGAPGNFVFGQWVVPEVLPWDPTLSSDLTVGFWVGIDGFGNDQVLQAGIAATVSPLFWEWPMWELPYAYVSWWAWTEWYTKKFQDPAVQVSNFPVATGDTVCFLVCAPEPDRGYVSMLNLSRGQHTGVEINARPGIESQGQSVEWIVEGVSDDLPAFDPITFNQCAAGTQSALLDLQPHGFVTEIEGSSGPITQASITSDTSAVVEWTGWG